jgi:hypothetical protein
MITTIIRNATGPQRRAAITHTADHLHVPEETVSIEVAVAYIVRHFEMGQLSGWDGFVENLEN